MCGEIIYSFPNISNEATEIWEWINNFIQYLTGNVIFIHAVIKFSPS